ncbi:VOC family protein [Halomonas sp. KO116]|uniref:VOC family protein n=1 Tax=Halomonas sp. KO116 TaxID=1504981 RepID=UPI0004E3752E|nr:VOC family protein [Halomonas sp. KO116]AJY52387.1 Glyoxalase/bleomycin resistance protein/dioxygenase [Halomonas sp. KO116]|tara:strand:+ start:1440 stop:2366 length:927 start_codon:yes stop_codon:yes gene_type:complete
MNNNRLLIDTNPSQQKLSGTRVSHIGFRVPDIEATTVFYQRVLGMAVHENSLEGVVRLGWGSGHHVIELTSGKYALTHFGFETQDSESINALQSRLEDANVVVRALDAAYMDAAVGDPQGIEFEDPDGNRVHFHTAMDHLGEHQADIGRRPIRFQHTTVGSDDVKRMVEFYANIVGFSLSDQLSNGNFAWLRSDRDHHTLAVVDIGMRGQLDHYSFDLSEWEDFKQWCDRLTDLNVEVTWGPGRHGPGNNLFVFFDDPAGTHIELSAEMEKFHDDLVTYVPRLWEPTPRSVNLWGGQLSKFRKMAKEA